VSGTGCGIDRAPKTICRGGRGCALLLGTVLLTALGARPAQALPSYALGRKNHLFAGSDGGAESRATIASLIQTAKLNDVEPFAYLRDVLERIVSGKTKANDFAALLPWAWKTSKAQAAVNA